MNSRTEHSYSPDPERMGIFCSRIEEMRSLMNVFSKKSKDPVLKNSETNGEDREEDSEENNRNDEDPVPFDPRD